MPITQQAIRVVSPSEFDPGTAQTPGSVRRAAIAPQLGVDTVLWGGVFVGIYTLLLAIVGSRFQGADLVGIYATMGLAWGGGALAGPLLTGAAADVTAHGLPIVTALLCLLYAGFVLRLRRSA